MHAPRRQIAGDADRGTAAGGGPRGFTLVELLVVVAIIGIVIAIVVPVAIGARRTAARVRDGAALRAVVAAWASYATDQRGFVLPGYRGGYDARDENGEPIPADAYGGSALLAKRYPWRLAPWLDQDFRRLYAGPGADVLARLQSGDRSKYFYFASLYPSFGLNSPFVGGDDDHFPSDPILSGGRENPLARYCVTRLSGATRPQRTIVFASARTGPITDGIVAEDSIVEGGFRVVAPWVANATPNWEAEYDPGRSASFGGLGARYGDEAATATIDGAVEFVQADALRDMTRWCDAAPGAEWWIGK